MEWKRIGMQEIKGRVVKCAVFRSDELWIFFEDGTLLELNSESDIVSQREPVSPLDGLAEGPLDRAALLERGVVDQSDIDAFEAEVAATKAADKARNEKTERIKYETLKAKFEKES